MEQTVQRLQQINQQLSAQTNDMDNMDQKDNIDMGMKGKIIQINNEMSQFRDIYNQNKLQSMSMNEPQSLMISVELKQLQTMNDLFGKTISDISIYINSHNSNIPNIINYDEWDINEMITWIKSLDGGIYIQYCDLLHDGFITDGVSSGGALLILDDQNDLRNEPFNITSFPHRKALINHFQSLPMLKQQMLQNNNNNNSNNHNINNHQTVNSSYM